MAHWQTARRWLLYLFFAGLMFLLAGCGGPGGEECGGADALVSCLIITSTTPMFADAESNQVDVLQNQDCDGDSTTNDPEPFDDHTVAVTFANLKFPTADESLPITIQSYSISYLINDCPAGSVCPPLTGFSINQTIFLEVGASTTIILPFFPGRVKQEYVNLGGELDPRFAPSYSARLTITGHTTFFEDSVFNRDVDAQFTIADFNRCGTL